MLLDKVNLNQLRVFQEVYRSKSMTTAAKNLFLTQSGVSQHIKSLEEALDAKLFDRINQRLIPTGEGKALFEKISLGLSSIEEALWELRDDKENMRGTVTLGMPIEFGNNKLLPLLSQFSKQHPHIKYKLYLDFAEVFNKDLLDGKLDFAFVDTFKMDRRITTEHVYTEILELCVSKKLLKNQKQVNQKKFYESLAYVEYQDGQPLLGMWMDHHLGNKKLQLEVMATVMDVQAVSKLVCMGIGAGILPHRRDDRLSDRRAREGLCARRDPDHLREAHDA